MELNNYQERAKETAQYPATLWYPALKLCGEAGEVAEKIGKLYRDNYGRITPAKRSEIMYELGDVLCYVANLANDLNYTLEDIAIGNLAKIESRKARGVIQGSGDDR
jgi:NTP pyrophosphatase (non-canonical NTP hydrolase)